jgi:hypothetical protein
MQSRAMTAVQRIYCWCRLTLYLHWGTWQLCVFAVDKCTGELARTGSIEVEGPLCVGFVPVENGTEAESDAQPPAEKPTTHSQL